MADHVFRNKQTDDGVFVECIVCGQRNGEHEPSCPRTRDWNIATREAITPTEIEAEPAPSVAAKRALRIEVDECNVGPKGCPFVHSQIGGYFCAHPNAPKNLADELSLLDDGCPEGCPLVGQLVLIGGPRAER